MARCGCHLPLLVLLVQVISLCESTEYYIRPNALTTNTSCPGQPCLTINQYMNNTSHYIQSNTVLNFLPGKHVLMIPLLVKNVENVTLKSITAGRVHSQLLVKFSCENDSLNHCIYTQSAIEILNVTNVVIKNISLEMGTSNVPGSFVEQNTHVHLQHDTYSVQGKGSHIIGIAVNETSHLYIDGLRAVNFYNGIRIEDTKNVKITNSSFDNCLNSGMVIIISEAIDIFHTTLSNNNENGMYLESCTNTTLTNISATNNQQDGMYLLSCSSVSLKDISAINNTRYGMNVLLSNNTDLKNINATNNQDSALFMSQCKHVRVMMMNMEKSQVIGMVLIFSSHMRLTNISSANNSRGMVMYKCENTTLMNISTIYNQYSGMYFGLNKDTTMTNISAINSQDGGIYFDSCENTTVINISAISNQHSGIAIYECENTTMMNISVLNNEHKGIVIHESENTTMMNVFAINNQYHGIHIYECDNITVMNVFALNNQQEGILFELCENTTMINISAINNQYFGLFIYECERTTMMNISVLNNQEEGMVFMSCENTTMMNISAISNQHSGIVMYACENTTMMNISAINNQYFGTYFDLCENTTMVNISAIKNQNSGTLIYQCENTTMVSISVINNQISGIVVYECESTTMMNISAINNQISGITMYACENTTMLNISAISNQYIGMYLDVCDNTTMMNISAIENQYDGILMYASENTTMMNISTLNNRNGVIIKEKCTDTILAYVNATYNKIGGILIENHFSNIVLRNISVNHNGNIQISLSSSHNIRLEDSIISDVIAFPSLNIATNPHTLPAVIELNDCTIIISKCIFTKNNITSIRAIGSKIIVEGEIIFSDNCALSGAALLFASSSVLVISESSSVNFQNNHAVNYGGAIYILTDEFYNNSKSIQDVLYNKSIQDVLHNKSFQEVLYNKSIDVMYSIRPSLVTPRTRCFLSVAGNRSQARLVFTNNTADKGGDVVYGGLVALGYDGDWNCLLSFKNISDMSEQNGLSIISSEPSHVCLCRDGQPDCLTVADPVTHSIYPGQTITLPAVVVGQDFGSVTGSVIAQFLQDYTTCPIQLEQGQKSTFVNNGQCADLKYTLYTSGGENCTAILTLKTNNGEVLQPMNTYDNHKIKMSWAILNQEPNYYELAFHFINETMTGDDHDLFHIMASNYSEAFVNNFLKFSLDDKFVFPNEIYSYPTFINISFRSCPLGFALSQTHHSDVTAIIFCNRCLEFHVTYNIKPSLVMDWCGWEHMTTIL